MAKRRGKKKSGGKKKGEMKLGTCRKTPKGPWVCKLKNGKVRFSKTNRYK